MVDHFARTAKIKDGGVARARRLRADPTHAEAKLWSHLRRLPIRFRRQVAIGPYVVDFACHRARLVIEVDGGVHNLPDVAVRDLKRDQWLSFEGYRILRIANQRVEKDIDGVLADIAKVVGVFVPAASPSASTPSQPFPLEGKGFSDF